MGQSGEDSEGDDAEYDGEMSADQKMAMQELRDMKLDLDYAGGYLLFVKVYGWVQRLIT